MASNRKVIFDLDGTLYTFKGGPSKTFASSYFYEDVKRHIGQYISSRLGVELDESEQIISTIDKEYNGELSIGFEKKFGIDRYEYYAQTWGIMAPEKYVDVNQTLKDVMVGYTGKAVLLTAAPRVWADKVLSLLGLSEVFGEYIISGEPDIRKPSQEVFEQARDLLGVAYADITSIGDQHYSDIEPAKKLGMKTIIIHAVQDSADERVDTIEEALLLLKGESDEAKTTN